MYSAIILGFPIPGYADYNHFTRLYTDGSKMDGVASAVVWQKLCKTVRLPGNASIFRAELYAISLALNIIRRCRDKDFIIFSVHV